MFKPSYMLFILQVVRGFRHWGGHILRTSAWLFAKPACGCLSRNNLATLLRLFMYIAMTMALIAKVLPLIDKI